MIRSEIPALVQGERKLKHKGTVQMKKTWLAVVAGSVVCIGLGVGCGKAGAEGNDGAVAEDAAALQPVPAQAVSPRDEAKASVDAAIAAVRAGRLDEVYGMLPASYQGDVSRVVQAYAAKIDRPLYEQGAGLLAAAGDLIAAQAQNLEELLGNAGELGLELPDAVDADAVTADQIRQAGQWIANVAKSLSYDDFAAGNIRPLLSNPLTAGLLSEGIAQLPPDAIACAFADDDGTPQAEGIQTLRLTTRASADDEPETEDVQFVKVEGKWVPLEMTQGWADAIQTAMQGAQAFEIDANARKTVDKLAPMLTRSLESLKSAQSAQELQAQAMGVAMTIGMMMQ